MKPSNSAKSKYDFGLGISDITIRVYCSQMDLVKILSARYADFPPHPVDSFTAQIDLTGEGLRTSREDTETNFQDGVLHFSAEGYKGYIDEKARYGYLRLSSMQPVEDIDYFIRNIFALLIHQKGGVLMHTAGIVRNDKTYLFFGHSGSGKTTICKASKDEFKILNDDLILLFPQNENWFAYGTPFWNPTQIKPNNYSAPVTSMYLLKQDSRVYTKEITSGKAIAALISNVPVIPQDPIRSSKLFDLLSEIQRNIPIYELHFLPDNSFWDVIQD
jgi:hypothetical protein